MSPTPAPIDAARFTELEERFDTMVGVWATTTDEQLHAPMAVTSEDLVPYSPIIEQRVGE